MADSLLGTNNTEYIAEDEYKDEAEINEADVNIVLDEESEDDDEDQSFSNDDEYESVSEDEDEDEAEINEADLNIFIDEESEDDDEGQSFRNDDEYESVSEDEDEAEINEADLNIFIDEESEDDDEGQSFSNDDEYESVSEDDNEEEAEINEADVNIVIDEESDDEDLSFSDDDEYESVSEDDEYESSVREDDEYESSVSEDDDDSEEEQEDDWGSRPSASSQGSVAAVEEKQLCDQTSSQAGPTGGGPCRSEFDSCPICMDAFHSVGDHQICCLPCGHLYGLSCITRWIKEHKQKCPQCNKKCRLSDVRKIYGQPVVVDQELVKKSQFLEAKCAYLEKKNIMREQLIANPNLIPFELTEAALGPQGHGRVTGFGYEARPTTHYKADHRGSSSSSVNSRMSHQESDLLREKTRSLNENLGKQWRTLVEQARTRVCAQQEEQSEIRAQMAASMATDQYR